MECFSSDSAETCTPHNNTAAPKPAASASGGAQRRSLARTAQQRRENAKHLQESGFIHPPPLNPNPMNPEPFKGLGLRAPSSWRR
eukprot:1495922-Rhodomonas_salina.2